MAACHSWAKLVAVDCSTMVGLEAESHCPFQIARLSDLRRITVAHGVSFNTSKTYRQPLLRRGAISKGLSRFDGGTAVDAVPLLPQSLPSSDTLSGVLVVIT